MTLSGISRTGAVVLLFLAAITTVWAGGSQEQVADVKEVKLVFWGALPPDKGPGGVVENYMLEHPGVTIEYIQYVNNDQGNVKLDTALLSGEKIDVFTTYGTTFLERRVSAKLAYDMGSFVRESGWDLAGDFGKPGASSISDGHVYYIPTTFLGYFFAVNKNMFDKAGIPIPTDWTWDDFRQVAQKLASGEGADKVWAVIRDHNNLWPTHMLASKYNTISELKDDMSGSQWKTLPEFREMFALLKEMMYTDKTIMPYEDILAQKLTDSNALATAFFSGRAAMMFTGSYMLRNLKDSATYPRDFIVGFAPMPKLEANQSIYYHLGGINDYMMINAKSELPKESFDFIKWYSTVGYDSMITGGRLPLYKQYDPAKAARLISMGAEGLLDEASFGSNVLAPKTNIVEDKPGSGEHAAELDKIYREEQEKYYLGYQDVDSLLDNLQKRYDAVLQRK